MAGGGASNTGGGAFNVAAAAAGSFAITFVTKSRSSFFVSKHPNSPNDPLPSFLCRPNIPDVRVVVTIA